MPAPIELPVEGLSDGRVRLRLATDADAEAIVEACQDPRIQRYTTVPVPYEDHHAREFGRRSAAGLAAGTDLATLIVDGESGELYGAAGLHGIDPETGRAFGGYWVAAPARGRGVASAAIRLLCGHGFERLGLARVELWIEPENRASQRVAERVGFAREGLLRSYMPIRGFRRDMLMYALLPGELR